MVEDVELATPQTQDATGLSGDIAAMVLTISGHHVGLAVDRMDGLLSLSAVHILRRRTTIAHLRSIFDEHIVGSSARGRDGISAQNFEAVLEEELRLISRRLRDGSYRFSSYREKLILRGAERPPRQISVPTVRDRIALRAIAEVLSTSFTDVQLNIPQVKVELVADELAKNIWSEYLRVDVVDFYPSISHAHLRKALGRKIRAPWLIELIMRSVQTPTIADRKRIGSSASKGVPQGLAVSNVLAEIALLEFDSKQLENGDLFYVRFVDDILALGGVGFGSDLFSEYRSQFHVIGLDLHDAITGGSKSGIGRVADGFQYLGYQFRGDAVDVRSESVERFKQSLADRVRDLAVSRDVHGQFSIEFKRAQWLLDLRITGCVFDRSHRGWIQYFRQANRISRFKEFDAFIERMFKRYDLPLSLRRKKAVRALWACKHPGGRSALYVPDFDHMSAANMRVIVGFYRDRSEVSALDDTSVRVLFRNIVGRAVINLERDIGHTS